MRFIKKKNLFLVPKYFSDFSNTLLFVYRSLYFPELTHILHTFQNLHQISSLLKTFLYIYLNPLLQTLIYSFLKLLPKSILYTFIEPSLYLSLSSLPSLPLPSSSPTPYLSPAKIDSMYILFTNSINLCLDENL